MSVSKIKFFAFVHLVWLVSSKQHQQKISVKRANNNFSQEKISSQSDLRLQLLWGETIESENWETFEDMRRFLGSSHSYSYSSDDDDDDDDDDDKNDDNNNDNGNNGSVGGNDFLFPTASPTSPNIETYGPTTNASQTSPNVETYGPTTRIVISTSSPTPSPSSSPTISLIETSQPTQSTPNTPEPTSIIESIPGEGQSESMRICPAKQNEDGMMQDPTSQIIKTSKLNFAYVAETKTSDTDFVVPVEKEILESVAKSMLHCEQRARRMNAVIKYSDEQMYDEVSDNIVAIDSAPEDKALPTAPCTKTDPKAEQCVVVLAYLTLAFSDDKTAGSKREVLRKIKADMENGVYLNSNISSNLIKVSYLGPDIEDNTTSDVKLFEKYDEPPPNDGTTAAFIFGATGFVLIAAILVNARRRRSKSREMAALDEKVDVDEKSLAEQSNALSHISAVIVSKVMRGEDASVLTDEESNNSRDEDIENDNPDLVPVDTDPSLQRQDAACDLMAEI